MILPLARNLSPLGRGRMLVVGGGGGTSNLVSEDFEGTGTPAGWTSGGNANFDYTTVVLAGAQSFDAGTNGGGAGGWGETPAFEDSPELFLYFMSRMREAPWNGTTPTRGFSIRNGATILLGVDFAADRIPVLRHGAVSQVGTAAWVLNTTYHVWVRYMKGSGGVAELWVSTTSTKPGAPTVSIITGDAVLNANRVRLGDGGARNPSMIYDKFRVSTSEFGSNPA